MAILDLDALAHDIDEVTGPNEGDRRMWSVTTIIDQVSKGEGLMYWACRQAAACAIDQADEWQTILETDGRNEAINWIGDARRRPATDKLRDQDLGTVTHMLAEQWVLSGERPRDDRIIELIYSVAGPNVPADVAFTEGLIIGAYLDQFGGWLDRFQPEYEAAEFVVYSPTYGYAGQADTILSIPCGPDWDRMRVLGDYKTSRNSMTGGKNPKPKRPYVETVLQLAAYRYAEVAAGTVARRYSYYSRRYYLLSAAEQALAVPMPEVDGAVCILITPESCEAFPMRADRDAFDAFLFCLEVARWNQQTSRGAIGDPLVAPSPQEV